MGKTVKENKGKMNSTWRKRLALAVAGLGLAFLCIGMARGENAVILRKAINICMECIGIG